MMNALDYNLGSDPSLLILDDDEPFTRTLGRAMERRGFEVKTLLTVKEGFDYVNKYPPAYEIIDLRIDDGNASFVQMGDVLHTPNLQLADPNISVLFDIDVEQGLKSRKHAFDMVCNDRIICSGGHILEPKFVYLDKFGNGYKYVAI